MNVTIHKAEDTDKNKPFVELLVEALHDADDLEFEIVEQIEEQLAS